MPVELVAVTRLARMSWWERFVRLELPFSTTGLVWNSMMSMAGGWFFLTVSEAFVLGEHDFRLPGLGSYMSLAIERGTGLTRVLATVFFVLALVFVWRSFYGMRIRGGTAAPAGERVPAHQLK